MYKENDLVRIAKRENNKKRNYLVVNKLQGKHIAVEPTKAFKMFKELAEVVMEQYPKEKILFIGFAETATAIGASVSSYFDAFYMQTTREVSPNVEYLYFSEEHSHATEQKLVKDDIDKVAENIDRIIFIEDEVTTGKTILNIINILEKQYPMIKKYSVASILNGMDDEALNKYKDREINLHYLVKTNHSNYSEVADKFLGDGKYIPSDISTINKTKVKFYEINSYMDSRRAVNTKKYQQCIDELCTSVVDKLDLSEKKNILVVGTEEFMYPAMCVGRRLEECGKNVMCHSTTRSPIVVSSENDYPLHSRYELRSLYDDNRVTFLYDINKYDSVIVVTDAMYSKGTGINTLINALAIKNDEIHVVRWC